MLETLDDLRNSFPPSTPSCFDESDDGENNGSTTDNYADDDENEETEETENDDFEFSPSSPTSLSFSSHSSVSSANPPSPRNPTIPPLLHVHQNTPQASPTSSPSSSPHLSRCNKKVPGSVFRFQLTHNKSGNISDSGSSSGGSLREKIINRNNSNRGNILNMTVPPATSPAVSPTSTPRKQPPPPIYVPYTTTSISEPNTPKGGRSTPSLGSASASDLPAHNDANAIARAETPSHDRKTKDYAKQFLRKFAPARFSRSKSDPCIICPPPSPTLMPVVQQQQQEDEVAVEGSKVAHATLRTRMRRRRDTGDPRLGRKDQWDAERDDAEALHAHDEPKDATHAPPTQEYATREDEENGNTEREKEYTGEFLYGRAGLVRSSPEPRAEYSMFGVGK